MKLCAECGFSLSFGNSVVRAHCVHIVNNTLMCGNCCSQSNDCFAVSSTLLRWFVSHKKHENKNVAPGPFPLLPSSALRETQRGKEKSGGGRKQSKNNENSQ